MKKVEVARVTCYTCGCGPTRSGEAERTFSGQHAEGSVCWRLVECTRGVCHTRRIEQTTRYVQAERCHRRLRLEKLSIRRHWSHTALQFHLFFRETFVRHLLARNTEAHSAQVGQIEHSLVSLVAQLQTPTAGHSPGQVKTASAYMLATSCNAGGQDKQSITP